MSEKRSAEKLADYRVDRGKGGFKAIPMTEREVEDRNFFIRLKLRGKPMSKLSGKQMDSFFDGIHWKLRADNACGT